MKPAYALVNLLENDATVTGIVGENITPQTAPQGKDVPSIVYFQVSGPPQRCAAGDAAYRVRFQLDLYANKYDTILRLDDAVKQALVGQSGVFEDQKVTNVQYIDSRDAGYQADLRIHRRITEYYLFIQP